MVCLLFTFLLSGTLVLALFNHPVLAEASVYLHPSDVSVSAGSLLPLSCVTRGSEQASWFRNNQFIASSTQTRLLSEEYTTDDGSRYTIRTLVLCGVESQDGGVYECGVDGGSNVTFTVNVHTSSRASFKLRLVGVNNNCGLWNSNDSARSQKVQELVSTLQQSALQGLCSTQSQQCSYDITNPSFDCTDGTESNTVTFTASIEVQSNGSDGSVTADNAVSRINSWKEADRQTVTLSFQTLTVDSSCATNTSVLCTPPIGPGASADPFSGLGNMQISGIVGGAIVGVIVVCATIVVLAVIIAIIKRKRSPPADPHPSSQLSTLIPPTHTLFANTQRMDTLDTMDKNASYGHTTFSDDTLEEGVYDNDVDNPTYDSIEQGEIAVAKASGDRN